MLPNDYLTSHFRMSGSRCVTTSLWLSGSCGSFFYSSSLYVFLPPLLNIFCFCQVYTISVLYSAHLCMRYSLGISNFVVEISSLSYSIFSPYFFALVAEEDFLISPSYSLELCIQMGMSFLFSFAFSFSSFLSYL